LIEFAANEVDIDETRPHRGEFIPHPSR